MNLPLLPWSHASRVGFCLITRLVFAAALVAQPAPLIELGSILDSVRVRPESGELWIDGNGNGNIHAAFLPAEVQKTTGQVYGALRVRGGGAVVAKIALFVEAMDERFSNLRTSGNPVAGMTTTHRIEKAGDYDFDFMIGERVIGRLPMSVVIANTGDEFAPTKLVTVEGPWSQWGYLAMKMDDPNPAVTFHVWMRKADPKAAVIPLSLQVVRDGVVVGEAPSAQTDFAGWERFNYSIIPPRGKASGVFARNELFSQDGTYLVLLKRKDGSVESVFSYAVKGGQVQPHARHASNYEPRLEAILPRKWAIGPSDRRQTWWTERVTGDAAKALLTQNEPKAVAGPSADSRARWAAPVDAAFAKLDLQITSTSTRADTTLAVGNGIIVFGTGGYTGVDYIKVGDPAPQSLPGGTDFHAQLFAVCGKKIILTKPDKTVSVFDTAAGTMTALDRGDVTVVKLVGGPFRQATMSANGNLVGVITEEASVKDRAAVKVIDVSGDAPVVISLRVPEGVLARNLTSIAIDAAAGKIAVSSRDGHALYVGDIAPGAALQKCDLSGTDGVAEAPILVRGGFVFYRDDSSSSGRARLWDLAKNAVVTPALETLPGKLQGVAINEKFFAAAIEPSHGSAYTIALAPLAGGEVKLPPEGDLGRGSSVTLADGGLLIAAGSGSLGSDMMLQVRRADGKWVEVKGADGKPIPAGDVVACGSLIAFKTGRSSTVTVAYVSAAKLAAME